MIPTSFTYLIEFTKARQRDMIEAAGRRVKPHAEADR